MVQRQFSSDLSVRKIIEVTEWTVSRYTVQYTMNVTSNRTKLVSKVILMKKIIKTEKLSSVSM